MHWGMGREVTLILKHNTPQYGLNNRDVFGSNSHLKYSTDKMSIKSPGANHNFMHLIGFAPLIKHMVCSV